MPRCNELRELRRRQLARQEEQRRTAYVNTLRHQQEHDRLHPGTYLQRRSNTLYGGLLWCRVVTHLLLQQEGAVPIIHF